MRHPYLTLLFDLHLCTFAYLFCPPQCITYSHLPPLGRSILIPLSSADPEPTVLVTIFRHLYRLSVVFFSGTASRRVACYWIGMDRK
ncbi:hypothetical protein OF83DRAFT_1100929 [Amylostereum chailletii]|nr:hypothetical protein OF83DRAFT_1100929 [Amylostereum chailletii]